MHWILECTSRRIFRCKGASSNRNKPIKTVYQHHEKKRRMYDQRIREIERGTFTPLVLSATGGMGPAASIFFKKLASMISAKRGHTYQKVMTWIKQRITFSLLRSAISAIRVTRPSMSPPPDPTMITIITRSGHNIDCIVYECIY